MENQKDFESLRLHRPKQAEVAIQVSSNSANSSTVIAPNPIFQPNPPRCRLGDILAEKDRSGQWIIHCEEVERLENNRHRVA